MSERGRRLRSTTNRRDAMQLPLTPAPAPVQDPHENYFGQRYHDEPARQGSRRGTYNEDDYSGLFDNPPTPMPVMYNGPSTPGMYNAPPTPAMYSGPSTPGMYNAPPTPAMYNGPPTPAMYNGPPTPAMYNGPPTPAMYNGPPTPAPPVHMYPATPYNMYQHPPETPSIPTNFAPPPTPGAPQQDYQQHPTLADTVEDYDDVVMPYQDQGDPGPASVASSLDTPHNSPPHNPEISSSYGYTGRGPNLSESSSDSEADVPPPKKPEPKTTATKRRRVSVSPNDRSKRTHLSSSSSNSKSTSESRTSRSGRREANRNRISSSSSSSPEMQGPPPTPRPVLKPDMAETSGKGYRVEELLKESSPGPGRKKRGVPKTPSPASSIDRSCTPEPQRLRQLTPSPVLNPPPTPAIPRVSSPMTTGGNVKAEPRTPAAWSNISPSQGSQSDKKIVLYDPKVKEKRMQQAQRSQKDYAISMWETKSTGGIISTPGTIKRVKMFNIMSHSKFELVFSPTFNFIQGENGSGKSAILSGIVAGLGGKAFDTGRATSMKDIIKNGQPSARIEITLNNYPSRMYGDEIRIVRCLSREGSSRYQISDGNKGLRSLGRSELNLVLSKLNIQVDNPLAILHQEMSRNFLRTKNPNLLYDYFYRALLLGSCENLLKKAAEDLQNAVKLLKTKKHLLEDLRTKERELKEEVELITNLQNCQQTLRKLEGEYVWAMVKEEDDVFQKVRKELDLASHRYEEAKQERDAVEAQQREFQRSQSSFHETWQEIQTKYQKLDKECEKKMVEGQNVKVRIQQVSVNLGYSRQGITQNQRRLCALETKVQQYEANMAHEYAEKMRNMELKRQAMEAEKQQLTSDLEQYNTTMQYEISEAQVHERAEQEQEFKAQELYEKLDGLRKELTECEKAKTNKYDVFSREMSRIVDRINSERRWKKKPRGPLGACITVKDPKWLHLVEFIFGQNLNSFAVDNTDDKKLLDAIIDGVYKQFGSKGSRPSICLLKFGEKRLDTQAGKARCPYPTMEDVIDISGSDYVVYNWLVDANNMERILLFENFHEACQFMKNKDVVPKTCSKGYTLDEYLIIPDPNYKALAQRKFKPARILKVTEETSTSVSNVQHLKEEIAVLQREFDHQNSLLCKLRQSTKMAKDKVAITSSRIKSINQRLSQIEWDIRNPSVPFNPQDDITAWREEIEELKIGIQDGENEKVRYMEELSHLNAQLNDQEVKRLEDEKEALKKQQRRMQHQKQNSEGQMAQFERALKSKEVTVNEANKKKVEAMKKYHEAEKLLKERTEIALNSCPTKVTTFSGTSLEIKNKYDSLKAELKRNQKKIRMYEDIQRRYQIAEANADNVAMEIKVMETLIMLAQPKIKLQQRHFQEKMLDYGTAIKFCFCRLIAARGYKGGLAISHEDRTLSCYVSSDKCSDDRAKRNLAIVDGHTKVVSKKGIMEFASGMSGGERSFTTICFLVSCWQLMDMPFYIVDEFDVFMDPMNRGISQSIVVEATKNKQGCQFFVFSPQPLEKDINPPKNGLLYELHKNRWEEARGRDEDESEGHRGRRALK